MKQAILLGLVVSLTVGVFVVFPAWVIWQVAVEDRRVNNKHTTACGKQGGYVLQLDRQKVCSVPGKGLVDAW